MERASEFTAGRVPGFHLFVESLAGGAGASTSSADLPVLAVPAGISFLVPSRGEVSLVSRRPEDAALVLEPVQVDGRARLLLLATGGGEPEQLLGADAATLSGRLRARLNGHAAPVLALLKVGDQLQLDAQVVVHVTEYREAGASRPTPELVGKPCGVCRVPLTAETSVYLCSCGLPLHLEGPPKPESDRMECALLGCPSCGASVRQEGEHVWVPEL